MEGTSNRPRGMEKWMYYGMILEAAHNKKKIKIIITFRIIIILKIYINVKLFPSNIYIIVVFNAKFSNDILLFRLNFLFLNVNDLKLIETFV